MNARMVTDGGVVLATARGARKVPATQRTVSLLMGLLAGLLVLDGVHICAAEAKPTLCVYDFAVADDSDSGRKMSEILRGRARRSGEYSLMVEIDREDVLDSHPLTPSLKTPLAEVVDHARTFFHAEDLIYGQIDRGGGEALTVHVRVFRIPKEGDPVERLSKDYAAANRHELMMVGDQVLADLAGRDAPLRRDKDLPITYEIVSDNLVPNPSFEKADLENPKLPADWIDASMKKQASWIDKPGGKSGDRKCLTLHPDRDMAESYGLIWYSAYIPVEPGAAYVLSMDLKSEGPAIIIWTKGYSKFGTEMRNSYKYQKRFYPEKKDEWERFQTEPFIPRNPAVKVDCVRVMLYAYLSPGTAFYDNVDLRKVKITAGSTRKGDFEDPTKSTEGWRDRKLVEGDQKEIADPEEKKDQKK